MCNISLNTQMMTIIKYDMSHYIKVSLCFKIITHCTQNASLFSLNQAIQDNLKPECPFVTLVSHMYIHVLTFTLPFYVYFSVLWNIAYICLQSRPVDPNVVRLFVYLFVRSFVSGHAEMTWWQDDGEDKEPGRMTQMT